MTNTNLFLVTNVNETSICFHGDVHLSFYGNPFQFERVYNSEYNTTRYHSLNPDTGERVTY